MKELNTGFKKYIYIYTFFLKIYIHHAYKLPFTSLFTMPSHFYVHILFCNIAVLLLIFYFIKAIDIYYFKSYVVPKSF